jgi:RHS repeat-associated protein
VVRQYTYGHDLLSQRQQIGALWQTHYYGYDGHGSARYLTDPSGAVTDAYAYDAFGSLVARTGSTPNDYLYAGEQYDPHAGFYYYPRAGYMSLSTGRFTTQDTYEGVSHDPATLHKYLYAGADPVNKVDPSGHFFGMADIGAANSIRSTLANIQINIGFAIVDQLLYGGSAGAESLAVAGILSLGTFALGTVVHAIVRGRNAIKPLRFSQVTASPFFDPDGPFAGKSIGQVVKLLRNKELSPAQLPVRYIVHGDYRLIVNTRSSLALIRAGIPESKWVLIPVETLEDGTDIAKRLAKNGLDESGTEVLRITGLGKRASNLE